MRRKERRRSTRSWWMVSTAQEGAGFLHTLQSSRRTNQLGAKEKAWRRKCDVRFSIATRNRVFQNNVRISARKLLRMGLVFAGVWRGQAFGISFTERSKFRQQQARHGLSRKIFLWRE